MEKSEKGVEKPPLQGKPKNKRLSIRSVKGRRYSTPRERDGQLSESAIPRDAHRKLWGLFAEIEREFEKVCIENAERNGLFCLYSFHYCRLGSFKVILNTVTHYPFDKHAGFLSA